MAFFGLAKRNISSLLILCLAIVLCSMPTLAQVQDDYLRYMPENQYSTLLVGETSVPIFDSEPTTPLSKGAVIILVSTGQYGLNFSEGQQLATMLNSWGWYTTVVPYALAVDSSEDMVESMEGGSAPIDSMLHPSVDYQSTQTQMMQLIAALYNHTSNHQGFKIIVSHGMHAAHILALTAEGQIAPPDSLVTISPYWPERMHNQKVTDNVAMTTSPLLDIGAPQSNNWDAMTLSDRRHKAIRQLKMHYRQKVINGSRVASSGQPDALSPHVAWLSKEIQGWLTHMGW